MAVPKVWSRQCALAADMSVWAVVSLQANHNDMTFLRAVLYWIACFLASIYLALLLAGCSTVPYWVKDVEPVPVFAVIEVDYVRCADDAMNIVGCANHLTGLIQIKRGQIGR